MSEAVEERGLIPKLRFPGFTEPWKCAQISSTLTILKGRGIPKADIAYDGVLPCIRYGELYTRYGNLIDDVFSRTNVPATELLLSVAGDVIIPSSGETKEDIATAACVLNSGVALGGDLSVLRGEQDGRWLSYYVNGRLKSAFAKVAQGDSVVHLYPDQIGRVVFAVPSKAEQQSIGQCLQSLDEVIAAETGKLDALKRHKKGMLQQLFPAEGETTPRLRFPQFANSGDWVFEVLENVGRVTTGAKDTQNRVEGGAYPFFVRSQTVERIDEYALDCEAVLTSGDGVGVGENFHFVRGRFNFHQRVYCIYGFRQGLDARFFYHYFSTHFGARVKQLSAKNSVDSVRRPMLTEMLIPIPDVIEQIAIRDTIDEIEASVSAQVSFLNHLRAHKAALMQQLFASLGEVEA